MRRGLPAYLALVALALESPAFAGSAVVPYSFGPVCSVDLDCLPVGVAADGPRVVIAMSCSDGSWLRWGETDRLCVRMGSYLQRFSGTIVAIASPRSRGPVHVLFQEATPRVVRVATCTFDEGHLTYACDEGRLIDAALPRDIALDEHTIYVLDAAAGRVYSVPRSSPATTPWTVALEQRWRDPFGIEADGSHLYVADTGNHHVSMDGTEVRGYWGRGAGQFRFPHDVAVGPAGEMLVADTYNHRLALFLDGKRPPVLWGHPPLVKNLTRVAIDTEHRMFATGPDRYGSTYRLFAFTRPDTTDAVKLILRDSTTDDGTEPSERGETADSPDILIRHAPDLPSDSDCADLARTPFQWPWHDRNNYVYVALHNAGAFDAVDNHVVFYWYDSASTLNLRRDGFYSRYVDGGESQPSHQLVVPIVPAGGCAVAGPLIWRPPAPSGNALSYGKFRLFARATQLDDPAPTDPHSTLVAESRKVTERRVTVLRGPLPTGPQDVLVLRADFPDVEGSVDEPATRALAEHAANWVEEVSWGQATLNLHFHPAPIAVPRPLTYYAAADRSLLVEFAESALLRYLADTDADALNGIERVLIFTNAPDVGDVATTGPWRYLLAGSHRYLSVSVHSFRATPEELAHATGHHFGLRDLYLYDRNTSTLPLADHWDAMALPFEGIHPLVWSKERAWWASSGSLPIEFIPRPQKDAPTVRRITIATQEASAPKNPIAVAIGLTPGVESFAAETRMILIEARSKTFGFDRALPGSGVLVYYANAAIPDGQGPVRVLDRTPATPLEDAALTQTGQSAYADQAGLTVELTRDDPGSPQVALVYDPPADRDLYLRPGDPDSWKSPDIWVDDPGNGMAPEGYDPHDQARAGERNLLHARVWNAGPTDAYDVGVTFSIAEPNPSVGGGYIDRHLVYLDRIPAGGAAIAKYWWTPRSGVHPHTCVKAILRENEGDPNPENDWAQKNIDVVQSVHGSPYSTVRYHFQATNERSTPQLFYFRVHNVPEGWSWSVEPPKALLDPGQTVQAELKLGPPPDAEDCTTHMVYVTGWTPAGDTLVQTGGTTLQVELRQKTELSVTSEAGGCKQDPQPRQPCATVEVRACTTPPRAAGQVILTYQAPESDPVYRTAWTNSEGCAEDLYRLAEGGDVSVRAEFAGDECAGRAGAEDVVSVPLPPKQPDISDLPEPGRRYCLERVSHEVEGKAVSARAEEAPAALCPTASTEFKLAFTFDAGNGSSGRLELWNLRLLSASSEEQRGVLRGRFYWEEGGRIAIGSVVGQTTGPATPLEAGTPPSFAGWSELLLDGVQTEGPGVGSGFRAEVSLHAPSAGPLTGSVEGFWERDCEASRHRVDAAVARAAVDSVPEQPCPRPLPCLTPVGLSATGELVKESLDSYSCNFYDTSAQIMATTGLCGTRATHSKLVVQIGLESPPDGPVNFAGVTFSVEDFLFLEDEQQLGTRTGHVEMHGVSGARGHGWIVGFHTDDQTDKSIVRGWLTSAVPSNGARHAQLLANYEIFRTAETGTRRTAVGMRIRGWLLDGCLGEPMRLLLPGPWLLDLIDSGDRPMQTGEQATPGLGVPRVLREQ